MSQSVKLSNGDYLDASGVWDINLGMTLAEVNNGAGTVTRFNVADVYSTGTNGTITCFKIGRLCFISVRNAAFSDQVASTQVNHHIPWTSLGMPASIENTYSAACCDNNSDVTGVIGANTGYFRIATYDTARVTASVIYIGAV